MKIALIQQAASEDREANRARGLSALEEAAGQGAEIICFAELAFEAVGLNFRDYLVRDPQFMRPAEVDELVGDPSKAKEVMGWEAETSFEELVRTLGLAYVWNIVGVVGALVAFSPTLSCVTAPVRILAWLLGLIAWFMAAKEALDLEWVETVVSVIIGWIVMFAIILAAGLVVGALGFGAALVGGILGS